MRVIVEADGGSRGNPGPAGYGAVVLDPADSQVLAERSESIGTATNNVAEYGGLIAGLRAAAELGATHVEVRMDSKLVVEQMSGRWQIKNAGLRPLAAQAADLARRFTAVSYSWIPRERNTRADALANRAMDSAAGIVRPERASPQENDAEGDLPRPPLAGPDSAGRIAARKVAADAALLARGAAGAIRSWEPRGGTPLRLLLVRHGETTRTAERRYSGRGDVPLTERGLAQARAVAARLAGVPLAAVVTSPLERCVRTAEVIALAERAPIVVDEDLVECDFGEWEGLTFRDVRERYPTELETWLGSTAVAPPGGESLDAVAVRVDRAVERLRAHGSGVVVVVSHVSPLKLILREALAAGDAFLYRCHLDPAGMSTVDMWPDGAVSVRSVNDTSHV
ncbi:bifunctional RNase H/acid phosphatase [Virgisporangium ochraceum]|uniref:Bifunctional RNase H/acid phosphatase n=1 Tax=Virgisporangium ochraceum TaxID=65505 RepID=A0A8J3ZQF5_9ACTN|nr:bifunctional RNase H/acid phosphatase [Virgisporangium ochraceum]GIJ68297.1 bifunctional RNase H/acid phosphatase [Virgisporangium ochraceum]